MKRLLGKASASARHPITGQAIRFLISGTANTLLTLCVYWLLLRWSPYQLAYSLSYVVGIISGFLLNTYFVFRVTWSWRKLMAFPLIHAINCLVGLGIVTCLVGLLGVSKVTAPIFSLAITLPLVFVLSRTVMAPRRRFDDNGNSAA